MQPEFHVAIFGTYFVTEVVVLRGFHVEAEARAYSRQIDGPCIWIRRSEEDTVAEQRAYAAGSNMPRAWVRVVVLGDMNWYVQTAWHMRAEQKVWAMWTCEGRAGNILWSMANLGAGIWAKSREHAQEQYEARTMLRTMDAPSVGPYR